MISSCYLEKVMDPQNLPKVVRRFACVVRKSKIEFEAIAFRGMSGALVAPMLAHHMKKGLLVVRKPSEQSHGAKVEGMIDAERYIIVDDFISSGKTVKEIQETIHHYRKAINEPVSAKCVGIFLYGRGPRHTGSRTNVPVFGCQKDDE